MPASMTRAASSSVASVRAVLGTLSKGAGGTKSARRKVGDGWSAVGPFGLTQMADSDPSYAVTVSICPGVRS